MLYEVITLIRHERIAQPRLKHNDVKIKLFMQILNQSRLHAAVFRYAVKVLT